MPFVRQIDVRYFYPPRPVMYYSKTKFVGFAFNPNDAHSILHFLDTTEAVTLL